MYLPKQPNQKKNYRNKKEDVKSEILLFIIFHYFTQWVFHTVLTNISLIQRGPDGRKPRLSPRLLTDLSKNG